MMFFRSPRAAPAGHTEPTRSEKSWIFAGWMAAASQSARGPTPLHCGHTHHRTAGYTHTVTAVCLFLYSL